MVIWINKLRQGRKEGGRWLGGFLHFQVQANENRVTVLSSLLLFLFEDTQLHTTQLLTYEMELLNYPSSPFPVFFAFISSHWSWLPDFYTHAFHLTFLVSGHCIFSCALRPDWLFHPSSHDAPGLNPVEHTPACIGQDARLPTETTLARSGRKKLLI